MLLSANLTHPVLLRTLCNPSDELGYAIPGAMVSTRFEPEQTQMTDLFEEMTKWLYPGFEVLKVSNSL
jgi:hypothetical protein